MHRKRPKEMPSFLKYTKKIAIIVLAIMMTLQNNPTMVSDLVGIEYASTVYAASAAQKITLDKKTVSIDEGESVTLKATVSPTKTSNKKVKWSSSNKEVAVVSSKGKIKALKAGTANITAKTSNGKKAMCKVTVTKIDTEITDIKLNHNNIELKSDEVITLEAIISPKNATNADLTWSSSDEDVVYVDSEGTLFPDLKGTAVITVESDNGIKATCSVRVSEGVVDEGEDISIIEGEGEDVADGDDLADAGDVPEAEVTEQVKVIATSVKLNQSAVSLKIGGSTTISAVISPANTTDKSITWASNNSSVATVGSNGTIEAKAKGTTTITASLTNGLKASCVITVTENIIVAGKINLNQTNVTLNVGNTVTLVGEVLPSNTSNKTISWVSDNEGVATVNSLGVVTAKAKGSATVTATVNSTVKANCVITVNEISTKTTLSNGKYIITLNNTNVSLDVTGASAANGANVEVYTNNNSAAQIWSLTNNSDGTMFLAPECAQDKVLDVMRTNNSVSGALQSGCNVDTYTHNDSPAQHFYLEQFSDGSYVIRLNSNSNLAVQATSASSGANVAVGNYDKNSTLQRWKLTPYTAPVPVSVSKTAYIYNTGGQGVFVRNQSSTSGTIVGGFAEGQEITVTGDSSNGWCPVKGSDRNTGAEITGYSHGDYITFSKPVVAASLYTWPVPGVKVISCYYGNGHVGLDIHTKAANTVVVAARGGVVFECKPNTCYHYSKSETGCNWGMGNYIKIRHDDGTYATYMHLAPDTFSVTVGQTVNQEDRLAVMGSSGNSTGPHLHFQLSNPDKSTINVNPDALHYSNY